MAGINIENNDKQRVQFANTQYSINTWKSRLQHCILEDLRSQNANYSMLDILYSWNDSRDDSKDRSMLQLIIERSLNR
jgi:hypothetical protein